MTVGTKTADLRANLWTGYTLYPSGTVVPWGNYPIGSYWSKSWTGADYPSEGNPDIFTKSWQKVDREIDSATKTGSSVTGTYTERWVRRKEAPPRVTRVEHNYVWNLESRNDKYVEIIYVNQFPPFAVNQVTKTCFRQQYGDGYTLSGNRWTSNDTIALQGKLREKIVGSDFDMGVFLGEGREACRMIGDTALYIARSLRALKKGDVVGAAKALRVNPPKNADRASEALLRARAVDRREASAQRILVNDRSGSKAAPGTAWDKEASSRWLELQYGWLPLISDTYGAAEALAQQLNHPSVQTYRARKRKILVVTPVPTVVQKKAYTAYAVDRGQIVARISEVNVAQLNGLIDPSSILWELTPWSFVVDWFIPIGNYLQARGLAQSVSGSFITTLSTIELFQVNSTLLQNYSSMPEPFWYRSWKSYGTRSCTTSLSTPPPRMKGLGEAASWKRATNAVALLTQVVRK